MVGRTNAGGVFPSTVILTPGGWLSGYAPTISGSSGYSITQPSANSSWKFAMTGSYGTNGNCDLSWPSNVVGKKARIYIRTYCPSDYGNHRFTYDGVIEEIANGRNVYSGKCLEYDDLSKLTHFSSKSAGNSRGNFEIYAIELI